MNSLADCPTPVSCQPGSCSWAELRSWGPHWALCPWWEPCSPHGLSQGPSVPAPGGPPWARPSWETWHVGGFLAILPTGHSESTQELAPSMNLGRLRPLLKGVAHLTLGLGRAGVLDEPRARQPPLYTLPRLDPGSSPSCSYLRISAAPQKWEQVVLSSVNNCGASRLTLSPLPSPS